VEKLMSLVAAQDLAGLRQAVHQMKGSGGGYGFQCLTDAAGIAERSLIAEAPVETIRAEVDSLVALIRRVRGYDAASSESAGAVLSQV
jgi:HPt (histidine-containing phosphotransfer) domain-containing protein